MGWGRLDDGWHDHPKVIAAGLEAAGLWTMCWTWAHKARRTSPTPGVVPEAVVSRFAGSKARKLSARLVEVGLWEAETADGYPIHDFDEYLPRYDTEQAKVAGSAGGKAKYGKQTAKRTASKPSSEPLANRQADSKQTDPRAYPRASARRNPVPVPTEEANASSAELDVADTSPPAAPDGAQALIAEWIDHCNGGRPPGRVIGQVAKELGLMLAEGIPTADVRTGLATWHGLGLHPSALASVVHESRTAADRQRRTPDRPNSAENRLAKSAEIAAQLRAERDQPLAIGDHLDLTEIGNLP